MNECKKKDNLCLVHWGIKGMKWGVRKEEEPVTSDRILPKSNSDIRALEQDERVTAKERMYYYNADTKRLINKDNNEYKIASRQNDREINHDTRDYKYKTSEMRAEKIVAGISVAALAAVGIIKAVGVVKGRIKDDESDPTPQKKKKGLLYRILGI